MNKYNVVGIMSGTSLDGLDVVWSKLSFNKTWFYEIIDGKTYEYSESWKSELKNAHKLQARDLVFLDKKLGNYIGEKINDFLKEKKIQKNRINLISSHGHTLFHEPENNLTKQIGDGAFICSKTNITTVSDFRTIDVAFGTAVNITDAGIGTVEDQQVSAVSSAITIAGSPAVDQLTYFQLFRDANAGGDTFSADARVLGIKIFFTTDAANDA